MLVPAALCLLAVFSVVALFHSGILWFNMPSRKEYPLRGVDVSHYQGDIDWQVIASQDISFVFIKATEGSGTTDEYFSANWENARAAGLAVGAYHFFSFDSPAATQAANFCTAVPVCADALPPVIDLEYYRSDNLPEQNAVRDSLREMLEVLQETYGKQPVIYTTESCWENYLKDSGLQYTLWIRSIFTTPPDDLAPSWTFWQYNPHKRLKGYTGPEKMIDMNLFRGSQDEWNQFLR